MAKQKEVRMVTGSLENTIAATIQSISSKHREIIREALITAQTNTTD